MARDRYLDAEGNSVPDRRHSATNGSGRDWTSLRAWAQALTMVGIPGAIAVGLVYVGATEIPRLSRQQEQILTEIKLSREATAANNELMNTLIRIAQRTCSNAAKDDNARQKCFDK